MNQIKAETLSKEDFLKLSRFIYQLSGIKMPESKKILVEARLRKRLKDLNIQSFKKYCEFLFSEEGSRNEITQMVDVITTNKTDFYREPKQFEFLKQTALKELSIVNGAGIIRPVNIWSAGCSTGEEPYTLAIELQEYANYSLGFKFNLIATDISTRVLEAACRGVYEESKISEIPPQIIKKYFLRSKDRSKKLVRVTPLIRNSVRFKWLNFMQEDYGLEQKFDIIFCRNVIIYFDKDTQENLIRRLLDYIVPGGYLFLGHSESIIKSNFPVTQVIASTYRKI
ncbi:MAG: chemotaxis protein CheR [Ignavibacteria bacterium]|nr:chemotaxis protein CheR [Ignavibacteria bacterium]